MMSKTRLKPNQLIKAKNVNLKINGEAEVRGGCIKVSEVAFGDTIDRFIHFKTDSYDKIIGYGGSDVKRLDFDSPDSWASLDAAMPDTDDFRSMVKADDMLYIGALDSRPRVYYPAQSVLWKAGITAPSTKCSTAEGAAGNLNGTYDWHYTYVNTTSGWESDPSPISDPRTVESKKVNLSGFIASAELGVDKINIFRNADGVPGQHWYIGQKDNDTSSFEDDVADDNLEIELTFRNGLPPKSGIFLYHLNRIFYVDEDNPSTVRWSEPLKPHAVHTDNEIKIEEKDGGRIVALAVSYDNIIAIKNTGIYIILFNYLSPLASSYNPVAVDYGCTAPMSVANIGEDVILLTTDGLKLIVNAGTQVRDIAIMVADETGVKPFPPVTNIFKDCKQDVIKKAVGIYYEHLDQYCVSLPYYSTNNDLTLVWHRAANIFSSHEGWNVKALASYREYDNKLLYRSHGDQYIYKHDTGNDDDGAAIKIDIHNGWHDLNGMPDFKKIRLVFPTIYGADNAVLKYQILKDFETAGEEEVITHEGASYWGDAHWGQNYWGASGEIMYRQEAYIKGRIFSTRFYGSTDKKIGISGYQYFFQPSSL